MKGAEITATNTGTGIAIKTSTTDAGYYSVPNLIPGAYSVKSEAPGFRPFEKTGIVLSVDTIARVDVQLTVGTLSESISVSADAAALKTDKADVSAVLNTKTMNELPVLNRNVSQLVSLLPGALRGTAAFIGENPSSDTNGFVNGNNDGNNYHQLDGIDNQETIQGVAMINPAIDSLQEVKITTNSYDAEFGQVAGAVFQASTKSGSNAFHGSAYEYLQNDKFFARNPFTQSTAKVAPWRWNQFGTSLGGPIRRDKLFFFGNWEGLRSRNGSTLQFGVPTEAMQRGDFSEFASQYPLFDPLTGDVNGRGRVQFANNIIPASRLNPITLKLVRQLPVPNTPDPTFTRNYTKSGSFVSDTDATNARIDYNHSPKTRLFGRYTYLRSRYDAPPIFGKTLGGAGFGPQAETGGTRTQNLSLDLTRVLRSNLITEVRVGFSRFRSNLAQPDVGALTADEIGIPGINKSADERTHGLPQMLFDGPILSFYVGNPFANFYEVEQSVQYVNNWSWTKSSHTVKWGADLRPRVKLQRIDKSFRGSFNFSRFGTGSADSTALTGIGFASFLLGQARSYSRGTYLRLPIEFQDRHGFYFQDQWRVTPKLSLMLGLRWEYFSPTYSKGKGGEVNFDLNTAEMVFAGTGSINKFAGVEPVHDTFGPRVGIAYTLVPRTVIRAGYGRSYFINRFGANFGTYCCQWPIGDNQSINAATLYTGIFPLSQGPPDPGNSAIRIPESGRLRVPDGQAVFARPFDDATSSLDSYNFTIQQQLTSSMTFEIGYVGSVGRHLWRPHQGNPAVPGAGALPARKPFGTRFGLTQGIDIRSSDGNSKFNSMQVRLDKRFSNGYQFLVSYTWQKTLFDTYQNPFDRNAYWNLSGPGRWLTLSHVLEVPFGKGKRYGQNASGVTQALLGGWQLAGITQIQDGSPISPTMAANTLNVDNYSQVPDRVGSGFVDNPAVDRWFDISAFRVPAAYKFGTSGLGVLTGPGWWVTDLSLDKSFTFRSPLNEQTRMAFRWQVFNTFNHVNPTNPDTRIDVPSVGGKIFNIQRDMRRMQVGIHLYF